MRVAAPAREVRKMPKNQGDEEKVYDGDRAKEIQITKIEGKGNRRWAQVRMCGELRT